MSATRAIERVSLPEAIANDLRERILNGEFQEGEVVRQEALALEYDVSRMPVRDALKLLDAEGLVQMAANRGATVVRHSLDEIREIFDLRSLLEVDLFRASIPNLSASDLEHAEALLARMDASYEEGDVSRWGALNQEYHSALYSAARRSITTDLLKGLSAHADRYVRLHLSVMERREPAKREHRDLLASARRGDVEEGCRVLAAHIARARDEILEMIVEKRAKEPGNVRNRKGTS